MARTINLGGMVFDYIVQREENRMSKTQALFRTQNNENLMECYKSVSGEKYRVYEAWKTWSRGVNLDNLFTVRNFNVESHNTWKYILSGVVVNEVTGESYYIKITPYNRYAYLLLDY